MPAHYLVVDLEATCADDGSVPKHESEIIEIGAVMVDATTLAPVGEHQTFIRPLRHPKLTPFCTKLTSIAQADVDGAPLFPDALKACAAWARGLSSSFVMSSWGAYDKKQLEHDCAHHRVAYPFGADHLNIKVAFSEQRRLRKKLGMGEALRLLGLPLHGTHHRGIDDARNIARLLPYALGRAVS